jgi:hypothetical protein
VRCEETSGSKQSRWRSSQDQSSQPPFVEPDSHDHFQPIFQHNHLCRASLAVWEYVEASIEYVFGDRLGDPDADAILDALRGAPEGLTRTQISELFSGHLSAGRLQRALGVLLKGEMATVTRIETGGRPAELWMFRSAKKAV